MEDYEDPAPVEIIQSPTNVHDSPTMMQHLAIFNEYASRIVKTHNFGPVSLPNKFFKPGTSVVYFDHDNVQYSINITDLRYLFAIGDNVDVKGAKDVEVTGVAYLYPTAGDSLNNNVDESTFYCG